MEENSFREDDLNLPVRPDPCTMIIFGATGDLTHRKLIPALYNLAVEGDLPPGMRVVGFARRKKSNEEFQKDLEEVNRKISRQGLHEGLWDQFSRNIVYHQSNFVNQEGYETLKTLLDEMEKDGASPNRLFYLASAPGFFDDILLHLRGSGLNQSNKGWCRVVVEKPFGIDLETAKHLNVVLADTFPEKDTYRIDHYLGKETAQNIMVLRFANALFEVLWNNRYVDQVQITCSEHFGMEGGRGGYYDESGALRDMVQSHLLQLLSLIAMEPPADLTPDGIRDEKVKVLKCLRSFTGPEDVARNVVRGQYAEGMVNGEKVVAYRGEDRVKPGSMTESYVALRLMIDNWRWEGVPFYMRMGKRLPKKTTEISIHLKQAPNVLFNALDGAEDMPGNVLVIRIQPNEGISLGMRSKHPGPAARLQPVKMDFRYQTSFGKSSPEAYERLLLDALAGDATLFARKDEVETAWEKIDPIEDVWHKSSDPPPMTEYPAGSWGPKEADELIQRDGRHWRRM